MANKPEYVDLISSATRQKWRRTNQRAASAPMAKEEVKDERRLSNWPPGRFAQWRLENLTPWKLTVKSWTFKDWL